MTEPAISQVGFYALWTPALLVSSAGGRTSPAEVVITAGGIDWPVVTLAVAAIGVLAARPISPKRNPPLSGMKNALVTLIMLITALLWVIDARPGLLFAFVISIGLGFSGYSLIELLGQEIAAWLKNAISALPLPRLKPPAQPSPEEDQP